MSYSRTIVCLANSRKLSGRCVAGIEVQGDRFGAWIRPVSSSEHGEIHREDRLAGGSEPELLDVVTVPLLRAVPHTYQTENHLVDAGRRWKRAGRLKFQELRRAIDCPDGVLWINGHSTYHGHNDKIPEGGCESLTRSLHLVAPGSLRVECHQEGAEFGNPRFAVRAHFQLYGHRYVLKVTDRAVESRMKANQTDLALKDSLLCISLGEPFQGAVYKLVAAVISPELNP